MAENRDPKPWLASYPDGVPEFVPEPPFKTLADLVRIAAKSYGKNKA